MKPFLHSVPSARRIPWWLVALLGAVPSLHAVVVLGRIHPDEVYQWLEPAYFKVHGYGVLAWEWRVGLRNWAGPLFLALWLKLAAWLGMESPRAYRTLLEVPQYLLHLITLAAVYRYSRRRVGEVWARLSVALVALYGLTILFAGRTLGESFSAAFVVLGLSSLDRVEADPNSTRRDGLWAGIWFGLSVVARYGSIPFVAGAWVWLIIRKEWKLLGWTTLGGAAVLLALGVLDWATWGRPFHSLWAYLNFNVFSGEAVRQFGQEPLSFYLESLPKLAPGWLLLGLVGVLVWERPRISAGILCSGAYALAIATAPHKETRFLYPLLFVLCFAAAPGVGFLLDRLPNKILKGCLASLCIALSPLSLFNKDWPELRGDQFRAQIQATRGNATGLLIVNEGIWGAGGYFYSGRNIPWTTADYGNQDSFRGAVSDSRVNRAITFEGRAAEDLRAAGFKPVEQIGRETIYMR